MIRKLSLFVSIMLLLTGSLCFAKPPVFITLTAPPNDTFVNKTIPIEAQIDQLPRVKSVKFYIDNTLVATDDTTPYQYSWDTTSSSDGRHQIYASILQAPDRPGPFDEASMTVLDSPKTTLTVDNTLPSVSITSPSNASFVVGTITAQAQVSDNLGLSKVDFNVDTVLAKEFTEAPYSYQWDTTKIEDGPHTFEVAAYDLAGNKTTSSVSITVDNSPPSTPVVTDDGKYTNSLTTLHASWSSEDAGAGISGYQYSVGTTPGSANVVDWTSAGTATEVSLTDLTLQHGKTYYFNLKAINGVGLTSSIGSSDGIMVNAHIPQITRIIPSNDSTFNIGSEVTIEVTAQDLDSDPLEYQFTEDSQVVQEWSSSNTFAWEVQNSESDKQQFTIEVRDDKGGLLSENISYNVQVAQVDPTPPSVPVLTVGTTSDSLDFISALSNSEDPESGIAEYQYALGTTPGGTDILYWTSSTEAPLYGLNLAEGQNYYLSVVAKNGAGLKSQPTVSSAIKATKTLNVRITSPQNNALITEDEYPIKGIAEGVTQVMINGKPVNVNPDGSFTGPTLVAPGYAKMNNITEDDTHIIMQYQDSPTGTHTLPTVISVLANGAEQDSITAYYYQLFVKLNWYEELYGTDENGNEESWPAFSIQQYNPSLFKDPPFADWLDPNNNVRRQMLYYSGYPAYYYWNSYPSFDVADYPKSFGVPSGSGWRSSTVLTIHTPPVMIKPFVVYFQNSYFMEKDVLPQPMPLDVNVYTVNGHSLKLLYSNGASTRQVYIIMDNYQLDTDYDITMATPDYGEIPLGGPYGNSVRKYFSCYGIDMVKLDVVREVPYNSGNYVPVNATCIFQPDDGKGRGPSLELANMPFLKLKFDQEPSDSQINTLEAYTTIAQESKTYNLTETAADSNIFVDPGSGTAIKLDSLSSLNPNAKDEFTCSVTSSFGNMNDRLFNLKESASDSLYFNDIKTFVTVTFDSELLPNQAGTLTIQYDNGMLTSEEVLTETSPDSLIFSNEDSSFSVKVNNYSGALPAVLDIAINNTDYLEISKAELMLPKVNDNPYVYTNEPLDSGSDLPPNNPLDEGQGVFQVTVKGLLPDIAFEPMPPLSVALTTDVELKTLDLIQQPDNSFIVPRTVLLPWDAVRYDGINCIYSTSGEKSLEAKLNEITKEYLDIYKGAFVGTTIPGLEYGFDFYYNAGMTSNIDEILHDNLGYSSVYDSTLTKKDFLDALPNYSVFFTTSHGYDPDFLFKGISLRSGGLQWGSATDKYPNIVFPEDVRNAIGFNSYRLVFINACLSADIFPDSNTDEFVATFNALNYLGWISSIEAAYSLNYSRKFFNTLSEKVKETGKSKTIKNAYQELIDEKFLRANKVRLLGTGEEVIDLN